MTPQILHNQFPPFFAVLGHRLLCPLGLDELQACPFPVVLFPPPLLSALSSFPFHCAWQNGFSHLMEGRHDHTTSVCGSLRWSGGLFVVWLPAGRTSSLVTWSLYEMHSIKILAPHFHGLYSFLELCCEGPWFTSIQEDGCDKRVHQSYIWTERNSPVIPNWF